MQESNIPGASASRQSGNAYVVSLREQSEAMNYNFTDQVRKVLAMAREEAIRLNHNYVGTEHILLGLIREDKGAAAAVLASLAVDLKQLREMVEDSARPGKPRFALGDLPYNSGAKKVLQFAMEEARNFGHGYVGTEHLLLGLLRRRRGITLFGLLPEPSSVPLQVE